MRTSVDCNSFLKGPLLLAYVLIGLKLTAKVEPNVTREEYKNICPAIKPIDTSITSKQIYIRGRVHESHNYNEFIPYATVLLKGTNIMTGTDSLGFYFLDITSIADTTTKYTILCTYIAYKTEEIVVKKRIRKTTVLNISLYLVPACEYYGVGDDGQKNPKIKKSKK